MQLTLGARDEQERSQREISVLDGLKASRSGTRREMTQKFRAHPAHAEDPSLPAPCRAAHNSPYSSHTGLFPLIAEGGAGCARALASPPSSHIVCLFPLLPLPFSVSFPVASRLLYIKFPYRALFRFSRAPPLPRSTEHI